MPAGDNRVRLSLSVSLSLSPFRPAGAEGRIHGELVGRSRCGVRWREIFMQELLLIPLCIPLCCSFPPSRRPSTMQLRSLPRAKPPSARGGYFQRELALRATAENSSPSPDTALKAVLAVTTQYLSLQRYSVTRGAWREGGIVTCHKRGEHFYHAELHAWNKVWQPKRSVSSLRKWWKQPSKVRLNRFGALLRASVLYMLPT